MYCTLTYVLAVIRMVLGGWVRMEMNFVATCVDVEKSVTKQLSKMSSVVTMIDIDIAIVIISNIV